MTFLGVVHADNVYKKKNNSDQKDGHASSEVTIFIKSWEIDDSGMGMSVSLRTEYVKKLTKQCEANKPKHGYKWCR